MSSNGIKDRVAIVGMSCTPFREHFEVRAARLLTQVDAIGFSLPTTLLSTEGDDVLLSEARCASRRILAELPTDEMRRRFEAAEPVHMLGQL